MLKITLTTDNKPPVTVRPGLKSMRDAKTALNSIKDDWALDGVPLHYDGLKLFVGTDITYSIEPERK